MSVPVVKGANDRRPVRRAGQIRNRGARGRSRAGPCPRRSGLRLPAPGLTLCHSTAPRRAAMSISTMISARRPSGSMPASSKSEASSRPTAAARRRCSSATTSSTSPSPFDAFPNRSLQVCGLLLGEAEHRAHRLPHPVARGARAGDRCTDLPQEDRVLLLDHREEEGLLRREVVVEDRARDAGPAGHVAHRRGPVAGIAEGVERRGRESAPGGRRPTSGAAPAPSSHRLARR